MRSDNKILIWLEALRITHWIKSGFCFAGVIFHGSALQWEAWYHVLPVAVCFSLVSSAGYLLNDLVNREEDCNHPRKKNRPIASGQIPIGSVVLAIVLLNALSFGIVFAKYGWGPVVWVIGGYFLLAWIYSFLVREVPFLDVFFLAAGFVARVVSGAYALNYFDETAYPTGWLLSCTYFLALLLGFGKRKGEWLLHEKTKRELGLTRKALRGYTSELLDVLTGCSALLAGGTYIAYCLNRPDRIPFVFTGIPALAGLMSYLHLTWRSTVVERPERLFLHSPILVASVAVWIVMVAAFTALV